MNSNELRAEVERLTASNDRLSRHIIGMGENLEASRRELLAIGWDAGWHGHFLETDHQRKDSSHPITKENPYRKPVLDFSGEIFCKTSDDA